MDHPGSWGSATFVFAIPDVNHVTISLLKIDLLSRVIYSPLILGSFGYAYSFCWNKTFLYPGFGKTTKPSFVKVRPRGMKQCLLGPIWLKLGVQRVHFLEHETRQETARITKSLKSTIEILALTRNIKNVRKEILSLMASCKTVFAIPSDKRRVWICPIGSAEFKTEGKAL